MKVDVEGLQEWFNFGKFHFTAQENHLCPQPLGKKVGAKSSAGAQSSYQTEEKSYLRHLKGWL